MLIKAIVNPDLFAHNFVFITLGQNDF